MNNAKRTGPARVLLTLTPENARHMEEILNAKPDNLGEWVAAITTLVGLIVSLFRKKKAQD